MEIAERITFEDIEAELVLEYTWKHRHITVSSRLPPDKRLRLIGYGAGNQPRLPKAAR
jgi:hypothetical protein